MRKLNQIQTAAARTYRASEVKPAQERNSHITQVVDSVIGLLDDVMELSVQTLEVIERKQTISHMNSGRPLPTAVKTKIDAIQDGVRRAHVCYQEGVAIDLKDEDLVVDLEELVDQSNALQRFIEGVVWFGYRRGSIQTLTQQIERVSTQTKKVRTTLGRYSPKVRMVDPVPQKTVVEIQNSRVLFDDQPTLLTPFLKQAKQRGWRVAEKAQQNQQEEDVFDEGYRLIQKLQKPISSLLPSDAVVGISKCPIITHTLSKPPDQLIQRFLSPPFEYDVYLLFNQYMILDNMLMLGLHKSIARVVDDDDNIVLDLDKFDSLLHFATAGNPALKYVTESTIPIKPAKRAGSHYYCPLCPSSMFNVWRGLKDWDPLVN